MALELKDYEVGQEAFYHETGDIYRVRVLESDGDKEWERYKLQVLEVIASGPLIAPAPPEIGEEFSCEKLRNVACGGLWHLLNH